MSYKVNVVKKNNYVEWTLTGPITSIGAYATQWCIPKEYIEYFVEAMRKSANQVLGMKDEF